MEDMSHLLPEEARNLRKFFEHERLVQQQTGEVNYEVNAEAIAVTTSKMSGGPVLAMVAKGVTMIIPADRRLFKRLKQEFEAEERWGKKLRAGETLHHHQISQHNEISW